MENKKQEKERIGIYGGTFSPPHLGHVRAASLFLAGETLDRLLIIPTLIPPHKERTEITSAEDRLAMCRMAFAFSEKTEISDIEIQRGGKSYTSETLRALRGEDRTLILLCGTDMLLSMDTWHEPNVIFSLAEIVCMRRESDAATERALTEKAIFYRESFGATVRFLDGTPFELSSSEVRARIASEDTTWKDFVSPDIAAYITERGLYR